jgi:pyruvate kinase
MNVARLNFAHGTVQGHKEDIERIRAVASRLQRHCMIMADLPGPKIRIGKLLDEPLLLEKGNEVILTVKDLVGTPNHIPVEYKRLPESVNPGSLIKECEYRAPCFVCNGDKNCKGRRDMLGESTLGATVNVCWE